MGIVSDALLHQLAEQIHAHRVVVWFDPEQAYTSVAGKINLPGTAVYRYDPHKGFLSLRRELEPLWSALGDVPPKLLIYVPCEPEESQHALEEYVVSGVAVAPGYQPIEHNTRLAVVARRALASVLPEATVESVISEVEKGKLTLAELETIAEKGFEIQTGSLAVIFGTGNPEEIALRFLSDPSVDHELAARGAEPALADLLGHAFGANLGEGDNLVDLRVRLARHLLLVDFLARIQGDTPPSLKTIPQPKEAAAREAVLHMVQSWRMRRDLVEAYIAAANNVEPDLNLGSLTWSLEILRQVETFKQIEGVLQALVEVELAEKPSAELLEIARIRSLGFWPNIQPEIRLRWQIIIKAGQAQLLAKKILQTLKAALPAEELFQRYISGETPWSELDSLLRQLEQDWTHFDLDQPEHDSLMKLVAATQQRFAEVIQEMTQCFIRAYEAAGFALGKVQQQARVYVDFVSPTLKTGKTAYILVDAFRYEMAQELLEQLPAEWQPDLTAALGTPPTITEVGMAALMPGAEKGMILVPAGSGKLGVVIQGITLKDRADRVKYLEAKAEGPVVAIKLNEIAPLKDKHLRARLAAARLVLVTATDEIDGMWETHPHMARSLQDHIFEQLRRGIRSLIGLGFQQVIITADHGYLTGPDLALGEPVDPPGGETADLHPRVWVGKGGASVSNFLRKPISAFGLGGDLELVTSYGLACFKASGAASDYYHGGLSLQELVIPVLTLKTGTISQDSKKPSYHWEVNLGSQKITTRFFSVVVKGSAKEFFAQPPRLRVELRVGDQVISVPVAATYGFHEATRDVAMQMDPNSPGILQPDTITLQVTDKPQAKKADLYILDEIGMSLAEIKDIPIDIAF